jgi:3-deoxy-D-arabino-heptulosonate 7-phosphate (DAHP) synthase
MAMMVILYTKPCAANPPKIDCTVEPCGVEQGNTITVVAESDKELKCLKAFLKQRKNSNTPMMFQNMISKKCIAIEMKREKEGRYVGRIDTSDLIQGEAFVKVYATDLDKEYATRIVPINID